MATNLAGTLVLPTIGADVDNWGQELNAAINAVARALDTVSTTVDGLSGTTGGGTTVTVADGVFSALADSVADPDAPVSSGSPLEIIGRTVPAIANTFVCIDVVTPSAADVIFDLVVVSGATRTTVASVTLAAGAYRAILPTAVSYPAGILFVIPRTSGGAGARIRHRFSGVWTTPTAPQRPTNVQVAGRASGVAAITWNAPTTGVTPISYTLYRNGIPLIGGLPGLGYSAPGDSPTDVYTVESVFPGVGSGQSTNVVSDPYLLDYSAVADGTAVPATDWSVFKPTGPGGDLRIDSGAMHFITGATGGSDAPVDRAKALLVKTGVGPSKSWQYEAYVKGDTSTAGFDVFLGGAWDATSTVLYPKDGYVNFRVSSANVQLNYKPAGGAFTTGTSYAINAYGASTERYLKFVSQEQADGTVKMTVYQGTNPTDATTVVGTLTTSAANGALITSGSVAVISRPGSSTAANYGVRHRLQRVVPLAKAG